MFTPRHVPQFVNPKAVTFEIDRDLLGPFSKIAVTKGSRLIDYCPLAQAVYDRGGDIKRVDLAAADGKTSFSIVRTAVDWSDRGIETAREVIATSLSSRPPVYVEALARDIPAQRAYNPNDNDVGMFLLNVFRDQVTPVLASHGGAMELLNVDVEPNGKFRGEVALVGSCHGCSSAELSTLAEAERRIRETLDIAKSKHRDDAGMQALNFTGITIVDVKDMVLTK